MWSRGISNHVLEVGQCHMTLAPQCHQSTTLWYVRHMLPLFVTLEWEYSRVVHNFGMRYITIAMLLEMVNTLYWNVFVDVRKRCRQWRSQDSSIGVQTFWVLELLGLMVQKTKIIRGFQVYKRRHVEFFIKKTFLKLFKRFLVKNDFVGKSIHQIIYPLSARV